MLPADDAPTSIHIGLDVYRHGCTKWRTAQLVFTRPLQLYCAARHGTRQQSGVASHIVGTVVAVTACAFNVLQGDGFLRQGKYQRQISPQVVNTLAVRPHLKRAVFVTGYGAGWAYGCVCQIGTRIGGLKAAYGLCGLIGWCFGFFLGNQRGFKGLRTQKSRHVVHGRQCIDFSPPRHRHQLAQCAHRLAFALCHHTQKTPVAHHTHHTGQGLYHRHIHIQQHRTRRRRMRDPAIQHAGQSHVVDKARLALELVGNIKALHVSN